MAKTFFAVKLTLSELIRRRSWFTRGEDVLRRLQCLEIVKGQKMKFTVHAAGVPAGSYHALFVGLDPYTDNSEKFGEGCLLKFKITSGDHKDAEATRIVSKKFSPKTNLYKFAKALVGRDLVSGEAFDFADHIGAKGMIIVEEVESGSTRVATFLKAAT